MGWFLCSGKSKKRVKKEQDKKSDDQIPSGIDVCRIRYFKEISIEFCAFLLCQNSSFFPFPLFLIY